MARLTIPKLFRSMAFQPSRKGRWNRLFPLYLESVEERITPATLPPPTVLTPTAITQPVAAAGFNPQVVADPNNPLDQVLVATTGTGTALSVIAEFSKDGGGSWAPVITGSPGNVIPFDTANFNLTPIAPNGGSARPQDPSVVNNGNPNPYIAASSISVAFGANQEIYYTYLVHNADKSSGAVVFREGLFGQYPDPSTYKILYQWEGSDAAFDPIIGVDNTAASYTDPGTGQVFGTNTMILPTGQSKAVYVAWDANALAAAGDQNSSGSFFNTNPILGVVSADDGATWNNPQPVSDGGFLVGPGSGSVGNP